MTRAAITRRRVVAVELGRRRSGRSGGAVGSVIAGNGRFRAALGGAPLGDQESVGRDTQGGVVVEAAPSAAFEMPEPDLLFEILVVAVDAPAQFGEVDQTPQSAPGPKLAVGMSALSGFLAAARNGTRNARRVRSAASSAWPRVPVLPNTIFE